MYWSGAKHGSKGVGIIKGGGCQSNMWVTYLHET